MKKILTISRADEYRAKIQKEKAKEEDFFYEVFRRSRKILDEIVKEQEKFLKDLKGEKCSPIRIKGMGNNIITFSAERGQGKTSTMQSFAEELRTETLKEDASKKYEVLDSIDPSSLETDESLVRVFISRLFFSINSKVEEDEVFKDQASLQKKQKLLDLFQKCFNNVDYIHSNGKKDCCQGELDYLAQLGDSSQLKENLYQLVKIYLEIIFSKEYDKNTFLIIQIDDVDLSTVGVFQMCEEVRRYLSIPNVVILMAADFEQIYYAVYQNYLIQHKELVNQHSFMVEECRQMAAKYLEKIFPAGHSVNLPQIEDFITSDNNNNIFLNYVTDSAEEEDTTLSIDIGKLNKVEDFKNIHQQLSRELYVKTGIIILQDDNIPHPFLPLTLREITHFTKLLYDMEDIDWDVIYTKHVTEAVEAEREKLKKNLDTLMNYFMYTWILNKLQLTEKEFFTEYINQKETSLKEYWENQEDNKSSLSKNLAVAFSIYLTILANQLSIAYLKEKQEQEHLHVVMEDLLWVSERQTNYKEKGRYQLSKFQISAIELNENLWDLIDIDIEDILDDVNKHCLECFLCPIIDGKRTRREEIFNEEGRNDIADFRWNYNIDTLELHLLNPIFSMFWKPEEGGWIDIEKSGNENSTDDIGEETEEQDKANNSHTADNDKSGLQRKDFRSIRETVTNGDVLCYILSVLDQEYKDVSKENFAKSWNTFYQEVIQAICFGLRNKHPYLKLPENNRIQETLDTYFVKDVMSCIFLSCKENRKAYIEESTKELDRLVNGLGIEKKTINDLMILINIVPWQPNILDWDSYKSYMHPSGIKTNMPDSIFKEIEKQIEGLEKMLSTIIKEDKLQEELIEKQQTQDKEKNEKNLEQKGNQNKTETNEEDK